MVNISETMRLERLITNFRHLSYDGCILFMFFQGGLDLDLFFVLSMRLGLRGNLLKNSAGSGLAVSERHLYFFV